MDLDQMINSNVSRTELFAYDYDIHGIVRVTSMFQLPELEYFRVNSLSADPDIRVRDVLRHIPTMRLRDPDYAWWQRLPVATSNLSPTALQWSGADD